MLTMEQALLRLATFWADQGCALGQPINTEVGAGTLNPLTFLRVLGPEPWRTAYVEPSVRPDDSRYGDNPNRMQTHTQYQVILKPDPGNPQELYLASLAALGIDTRRHDVRFVEDNWESPALGAWGLGWEVWLDGLEITQFTYFQQAGGVTLEPVSVEITYGLDRILMAVQRVSHFKNIRYTDDISFGEIQGEAELEMSRFYVDEADVPAHREMFEMHAAEAQRMIDARLPLPAYYQVLKCSHTFNVLDSRGAVGATERARTFARIRGLAHDVAERWIERRAELGHPLGETPPVQVPELAAAEQDAAAGPRSLLVEVGCEELPPGEVTSLIAQLDTALRGELEAAHLEFADLAVTGTPRRIVAWVESLADRQPERTVTVRGPKAEAAYAPDGMPTAAAAGFARKHGVEVADLARQDYDGVDYVVVERSEGGAPTHALLRDLLPAALGRLAVDRSMRWAAGMPIAFSRPIRWIAALYGDEVVPFTMGPVAAGRTTHLLRDAEPPLVALESADDYKEAMGAAGIVYDQVERAARIEEEAGQLAAAAGGRIDFAAEEELVEEVTNLVENPVPILGRFDEDFLQLPAEVLAVVMKKHQRYLPLRIESGELMSMFAAVANGPVDVDAVRAGNEAVLRARFADAAFFFERDLRRPLESYRAALADLVFEERAGSMLDRAERIAGNARHLAARLGLAGAEHETAERAATLAKADLTTSMVVEFSSLAGVMGSIYARRSGETDAVAEAIFEHTLPRHAGDVLPQTRPGAVLAIADRVDALTALFAVGGQPTGSADPYGLRRAANGLIQIVVAHDLDLDLEEVFAHAAGLQPVPMPAGAMEDLVAFTARRFEQRLLDDGNPATQVQSVMGNASRPAVAAQVLEELQALTGTEALARAGAAFRRAGRITKDTPARQVEPALFETPAEEALWEAYQAAADKLRNGGAPTLRRLVYASADLARAVDTFFEEVLVMAEDPAVRANRLALLAAVRDLGGGLVDWEATSQLEKA